jgi:hypothetical protein
LIENADVSLPLSAQEFAAMPLEGQLSALRAVLPSAEPGALLELCAGLRDHAPLSWLCAQLALRGWLRGEAERQWFARFLVGLSGTAVDKVLRALRDEVRRGGIQATEDLAATLIAALRVVPISRLPALCLIDRALKHTFPDVRDRHVEAQVRGCRAAIDAGRVDELDLARLAQLPSRAVVTLRERARSGPAGALEAFDALRAELARKAIEVLGNAPKAISQANAEELLSRRVYTDPGHFLIELLQNAEDAGATTWRLTFDARRIVVWHDGLPFNAMDVVGVCSIGQTTKRRQQIGFFGVGFKSVYEVSDRPRIYSDVYRFEIADVSIPKALSSWPSDLPQDGTVVVLPLRDPDDAQRSPRALYDKARALDPVVLFTLREIDVIELELTEAAGGPAFHAIREGVAPRTGWATIRQEPDGWRRVYAVQDDEYRYDGGWREPGKADSTRVMVGIQLDPDRGVPVPLSPEECTVYSFLPTEEHSGLQFFVQGHFDVPVDRERVTQDSAWNRWILGKVPLQLARLARRVVHGIDRAEVARGLLGLIPMVGELTSPIFRRMTLALPAAFRDVDVVPCTDGALRPPPSTVVAPAGIAAIFEGEAVPLPDGARHLADPDLPDRAVQVVRALGCRDLDVEQLVALLERELDPVVDGGRASPDAPVFLRDPTPARVIALHGLLLGELERLERSMERLVASRLLERLRRLPLVLGGDGGWYRPDTVARGDARLRAIFRGLRVFAHEEIDDGGEERRGGLLDRLGVRRLEPRSLVRDLEGALAGRDLLERPEAAALPGTGERLGLILELLAETSHALRARTRRLPLFPARDGKLHPVARDPGDLAGVLSADPGSAVAAELLGLYGPLRPLLAEEAAGLVQPFAIPELGLDTLVTDLARRPPLFGSLARVHAVLEAVRDEIPARLRQDLVRLPIWPDRSGTPRPLEGEGAVFREADEDVRALFPEAPFLDEEVQGRAHLAQMGVEPVGGEAVLVALGPDAVPPLRIEAGPETLPAVQAYLLEHADEIKARTSRELVPELPLFLCDRGRVSRLTELCLPESAELRALYSRDDHRRFIAPESVDLALLRRFRLEGRLERADSATLVGDLEEVDADLRGRGLDGPLPVVGDGSGLWALLSYLAAHTHELTRAMVRRALALPVYPDRHGRLDAVPPLRPCEPELRPLFELAGLRLLDARAQPLIEPLIEADGVEQADIGTMVSLLEPGRREQSAPLFDPPALFRVQEALLSRRAALVHRFPLSESATGPCSPVLSGLPIWRAADGSLRPAVEVVDHAPLLELMDPGTPEREALDRVRLDDEEQTARLRALSPLCRPQDAAVFLAGLVERLARVEQPLGSQTPLLARPERVARVAGVLPPDAAPLWFDAGGRLRRDAPRRADAETLEVLAGTEAGAALLHPRLAELLPPEALERIPLLPAREVLAIINDSSPREPDRGEAFYAWLLAHEHELLSDGAARELLRESRLFPSRGGRLLTPAELVLDPDLPDLGIDWQPHAEVPRDVLDLLARHLGVGRPRIEELAEEHLLPAYRRAVAAGDGARAAELLGYLAGQLEGGSTERVRALICPPGAPLLLEDQRGAFRPVDQLLLADEQIAGQLEAVLGDYPRPSPSRYLGATVGRFLAQIGVPRVPSLARLRQAMDSLSPEGGRALAALLGHLHRSGAVTAEELAGELPLRRAAWVTDGTGCLRRPAELFLWSPEVEALVGDFGELYPHPEVPTHLGDELCQRLGLRTARDVRVEEVVFHIKTRAASGGPVPFRVYTWMEQGLAGGWLDPGALAQLLGEERWICSDDGEYFGHRRVVGRRALQLFGDRRGYWERGREACPTLCRVFGIPDEVTARTVVLFLEELAAEVQAAGDRALLRREPALPRMLLACYTLLGRDEAGSVGPGLPLILCGEGGRGEGELRLLPATTRQLYRSDTPTLEALFSGAGVFYLAARGPAEEREAVDRFLERMRIRRLRDAYTVMVDDAGRDRSASRAGQLGALLSVLAALATVLPRVRRQRAEWLDPSGWVDRERLGPLVAAGRVRAIEGLRVAYRLDGVGEVQREIPAVFDPALGELLVDAAVLDDPDLVSTHLASGVTRCVYEGPGEEALTDIIEILLPLGNRERMDAYLDRRHFPEGEPEAPEADARKRLADRLAEILDYGLDRRLKQRFPALADRDLSVWRDPELPRRMLPGEEELTLAAAAARATPLLLDAVGVSEPGAGLSEALRTLLAAPSLSEVPPGLLGPSPSLADPDLDAAPPLSPLPAGAGAPMGQAPVNEEIWDLLSEAFRELKQREGSPPPPPPSIPRASGGGAGPTAPPPLVEPPGPVGRRGFWDRVKGWFFSEEQQERLRAVNLAPLSVPAWAEEDGSSFAPMSRIGPQLWATPAELDRVARGRPVGQLYHAPSRLPVPYRYAPHLLGGTFDPGSQSWTPEGVPDLRELATGQPTGRTVELQGWLPPGPCLLPVPLYARPCGVPRASGDGEGSLELLPRDRLGGQRAQVHGDEPVAVGYEVELLEAPQLTRAQASLAGATPALTVPTVERRRLPGAARRWLDQKQEQALPDWELALDAQAFVQRHYRYDRAFRQREDVRRAFEQLRPGRGNHHLELLHASNDGGPELGRGICYELNVMIVELLRHLGVPALVGAGWLLDEGVVDRPDHLFALALLPSPAGPCLLPLEAAMGADGPIRPLARRVSSERAVGLPPRPAVPPVPGPWSAPPAAVTDPESVRRAEAQRTASEEQLLRRAIRLCAHVRGEPEPEGLDAVGEGSLRLLAEKALGDPALLGPLLTALRQEGSVQTALTAPLQELVRLGLLQLRSVPSFQVWPADRG